MKRLLIVEDEPDLQGLLAEKLKKDGYKVSCANEGTAALKLALDVHPDLILLDLVLPKMGGIEMLKQLRKDDWGKTAKVIVLTNKDDQAHVAEAVNVEVDVYLVKAETTLTDIVKSIKQTLGE